MTYLFDGSILHRDSLGSEQPIAPGDVNWMTAGRGIANSERTDPTLRTHTNRLFGIQSWVALPKGAEEAAPANPAPSSRSRSIPTEVMRSGGIAAASGI